jgi:hypothetical protein
MVTVKALYRAIAMALALWLPMTAEKISFFLSGRWLGSCMEIEFLSVF